jgi:hypothetical protein
MTGDEFIRLALQNCQFRASLRYSIAIASAIPIENILSEYFRFLCLQ